MTDKLRIAVADDEALIRRYFQEILPDMGHTVVAAAADGEELVAACAREKPELVITDIRMPNLDGIEAALTIFAERPMPIILVSAFNDDDLVERAAQSQAMAYLIKPIERAHLETTIPMACRSFAQIEQLQAETIRLTQSLEDRKVIEKAKGLIMKNLSLDEAAALRAMQKMACEKNRKLVDVARLVIESEDRS